MSWSDVRAARFSISQILQKQSIVEIAADGIRFEWKPFQIS